MGNAEGFLIMWFIMNVKWATNSTIISQVTDRSLVIAQTKVQSRLDLHSFSYTHIIISVRISPPPVPTSGEGVMPTTRLCLPASVNRDCETQCGAFLLIPSATTDYPYQNREEQNEKEEIGEFRFHRIVRQLLGAE